MLTNKCAEAYLGLFALHHKVGGHMKAQHQVATWSQELLVGKPVHIVDTKQALTGFT